MFMAYTCNPVYSGDRDQKDCGSKLARENRLQDPISKKTQHKNRAGGGIYFCSWFQSFQPIVSWLQGFWTCHEAKHYDGRSGWGRDAPLLATRKQRGKGKGQ
jgi:hypothetical protein